jgi:predicted ribosomally synthesized peptide with nif11-like leader
VSVADLKAYGKRAATDPAVRQRAKEIGLQNVKGQAEYAKTLGFNFDSNDMAALAKEVKPQSELSEEQLTSVAGGVVTSVAAAVVTAGVAVGTAVTAVTASTSAGGW